MKECDLNSNFNFQNQHVQTFARTVTCPRAFVSRVTGVGTGTSAMWPAVVTVSSTV